MRTAARTLVTAYLGKIQDAHSLEVELTALLKGTELCLYRGLMNVIVEGHYITLIESLRKCGTLSWEIMTTWHNLLALLSKALSYIGGKQSSVNVPLIGLLMLLQKWNFLES